MNLSAQGWPIFTPKTAVLRRLLPASEDLKHKRIYVEASIEPSVTEKGAQSVPGLLKTRLITMVQHDPRLVVDEARPETVLKVRLTSYFTELWNVGEGQYQRQEWRGKMEVSYQAVEIASNTVVDSENIPVAVGYSAAESRSRLREAGLGSENLVVEKLVDGIYEAVGQRVSPTVQLIQVALPTKKLDPISAFAQTGDWGRVESEASKMDPFPKPQDDAYRKYLIGLAKEAKAYALVIEANEREMGRKPEVPKEQARAQFAVAKNLTDEARTIYKEVSEADPNDKNFRPGVSRTDEALAVFEGIERTWAKEGERESREKERLAKEAAEAARKTPLDKVLDFCRAGIDGNSIGEYINSQDFLDDAKTSNYKFNFATDMLALNNTCKAAAPKLQTLMRQRLNPSAPPPAPAPGAATPTALPAKPPAASKTTKAAPKSTPPAPPQPQQ